MLRRKDAKIFMNTTIQDILRDIRKEFFAFRNGIIADKLRKAGDPHPMIMGCLLVDVISIAQRTRESIDDETKLAAIAQELWNDTNSRECRLAAPMLYPAQIMTLALAKEWCYTVETVEVADNLCHKLLRQTKDAEDLMSQLITHENSLVKYTGYRLMLNLLLLSKIQFGDRLNTIVENEAKQAQQPLKSLLKDILEELE